MQYHPYTHSPFLHRSPTPLSRRLCLHISCLKAHIHIPHTRFDFAFLISPLSVLLLAQLVKKLKTFIFATFKGYFPTENLLR